jgi:hypothetical protein
MVYGAVVATAYLTDIPHRHPILVLQTITLQRGMVKLNLIDGRTEVKVFVPARVKRPIEELLLFLLIINQRTIRVIGFGHTRILRVSPHMIPDTIQLD